MKHHKALVAVGTLLALAALPGCSSSMGDTPFFADGTQNAHSVGSGSASSSTTDGDGDSRGKGEPSSQGGSSSGGSTDGSSGGSSPGGGSSVSGDPTSPPPGVEVEGLKVDEKTGTVSADNVFVGSDDTTEVSPEELQRRVDEEAKKNARTPSSDDEGAAGDDAHVAAANRAFNGLAESVEKGDWTTACEEYVYISKATSVSDCAQRLEGIYGYGNTHGVRMSPENTQVVVFNKTQMASMIKGEFHENAEPTQYEFIDGKWKIVLL